MRWLRRFPLPRVCETLFDVACRLRRRRYIVQALHPLHEFIKLPDSSFLITLASALPRRRRDLLLLLRTAAILVLALAHLLNKVAHRGGNVLLRGLLLTLLAIV